MPIDKPFPHVLLHDCWPSSAGVSIALAVSTAAAADAEADDAAASVVLLLLLLILMIILVPLMLKFHPNTAYRVVTQLKCINAF